MGEILAGSSPGIPVSEVIAICADDFGYRPDNTRFTAQVIRNLNRAIHDIWLKYPGIRRFKVVEAEVTLQAGVAEYDVALQVADGGWGWDNCVKIESVRIDSNGPQLEQISYDTYRKRQDYMLDAGVPETLVIIDQRRVRIVPTPLTAATGVGDYFRASPYLSDPSDRIQWPQGWDQVACLGAEYYLARFYRPELVPSMKDDFQNAFELLKWNELTSGPKISYALVARTMNRRRGIPHDNSQDIGGGWR